MDVFEWVDPRQDALARVAAGAEYPAKEMIFGNPRIMLDSVAAEPREALSVTWKTGVMWRVPGPLSGLGPRGYRRSDERILEEVCERLTRHGQVDASEVEVSVQDGVVTLRGSIPHQAMLRQAQVTAAGVGGVVAVRNLLRLA